MKSVLKFKENIFHRHKLSRRIYLLQYLSFIDLQQGGSLSLEWLFLALEAAECMLKKSRIFISKL